MRRASFLAGALALGVASVGSICGLPSPGHAQSGVGWGNTGGSVAFVSEAGHDAQLEKAQIVAGPLQ